MTTRPKWTEDDVSNTSSRNIEYGNSNVAQTLRFVQDTDKKERLGYLQCKYCWYYRSGGLAGQAFTHWNCWTCDKEDMNPNTAVPRLCKPCGKKYSLCVECAGDLHMRVRRKEML